jgi:hypothetical protein
MRAVPLLLLLAAVAWGNAGADPTLLGGGAFIVHQVPQLAYSDDPPTGDWCTSYAPYAIHACDAQLNRVDVTEPIRVVWFVVAAWLEEKRWCGAEFGFGAYSPSLFSFVGHGACFPSHGLALPTDGWPAPNEGIALATSDQAWSGNYVPLYWFCGYAYDIGTPGVLPLAASPMTGFAGTSNCLTPPHLWPAIELGGLGINTDGIFACPQVTPYVCCVGSDCQLVGTEGECDALGGEWHPEWDSCGRPDPCSTTIHDVCCVGEHCHFVTEQECDGLGGVWHPEWGSCHPNPCAPPDVCCLSGDCFILPYVECHALGGEWLPMYDGCDPNPCVTLRVCCFEGVCRYVSQDACDGLGGEWHPEWDSCGPPNPCPAGPDVRVCCVGGSCLVIMEEECLASGGIWVPGWGDCDPNNCHFVPPPPFPCCVGEQCVLVQTGLDCHDQDGVLHPLSHDCDPDPCTPALSCCWIGDTCYLVSEEECWLMGGVWVPPDYCYADGRDCGGGAGPPTLCCIGDLCYFLDEVLCTDSGGEWHPEWESCEPNPCATVPITPTTWGAIKALYR